ncbi:MAG: hypothetical protein IIC01_10640, partial [Planctomycetes bacterium]|nr:hypothetical protein [Planctomycetota bacterium]
MIEWVSPAAEYLWRNGLSAIPLVLMVTAATRWLPCRPSTKHLLWLMVLGWLVTPPLVPGIPGLADPVEPEPVLAGLHEESAPAIESRTSKAESRKSKVEGRKSKVRTADPNTTVVSASRSTVRPASRVPNRLARVPEAAGPKTNGNPISSSADTFSLRESRRSKVECRKSEVESRRSKNRGRGFGQNGSKVESLKSPERKQWGAITGWSALEDSRLGIG